MLTPFPKVPVCADRQESGAHTTGDVSDAGSAHVPDWLILSGLDAASQVLPDLWA